MVAVGVVGCAESGNSPAPNSPAPTHATIVAPPVPAPSAPVPAAVRVPELSQFAGLRPQDIVALIGEPDFRRAEPPAELWQYRTGDCVLDLFLYAEGSEGLRVTHSAARPRSAAPTDAGRCAGIAAPLAARRMHTSL
jgi:hypothetical protein